MLLLPSLALAAPKQEHGAVASDHALASAVGVAILHHGGNAIDAAIATALVIGVVNPPGSGLGGGGFLVAWLDGKAHVLDFREVAPAAATRGMFLGTDGKPNPEASQHGGLSIAVPAESIGLAEASRRWGRLPWRALVEPARSLAAEGFPCGQHLAEMASEFAGTLPPTSQILTWLAPRGRALTVGEIVRRPALAATLGRLAEHPDALQRGELADALVDAVRASGGILTAHDLAAYRPVERVAVEGRFRRLRVLSMPPPGGGLTLIEALQILDELGPRPTDETIAVHREIEAMNHAFADRPSIADPAFVDVPEQRLASRALARELAARVHDDRVLPVDQYGARAAPPSAARDHGTSNLCVVDGRGDAVALTTTINLGFGSGIEAAGVILNDQMDDFSAAPGQLNALGLLGDDRNAIQPGKRPQSSMAPTLLLDDKGVAICAGGSGGPTIVTGTLQVIVNVVDRHLGATEAIAAPRVHAQWRPETVLVEDAMPAPIFDGLGRLGHRVQRKKSIAAEETILRRAPGWDPASDPRKSARAVSY